MEYVKRIVCLANSYKPPHGRCVAGIVLGTGEWVRPVSSRPKGELSLAEASLDTGGLPALLDVIDIPLAGSLPLRPQTENHLLASDAWKKRGEFMAGRLIDIAENPETLWAPGESTSAGLNDCLPAKMAGEESGSLYLIHPESFALRVLTGPRGTPRCRGLIVYKGVHYNLSVTDSALKLPSEGEHPMSGVHLCISLTQPYEKDGRCHKLVAGIIAKP